MAKGMGQYQLDAQAESLKNRLLEIIKDIDKYQDNIKRVYGEDLDDSQMQDKEMIQDFAVTKFKDRYHNVGMALSYLDNEPKMWMDMINAKLFKPVRFPVLYKAVKESYNDC